MHSRRLPMLAPLPAALALLAGCATTLTQDGLEQRTAQAIGRPVGQFTITDRTEETGGRINYTVNTRDGAVYRCYLYGATAFQKAISFGQIPHSDAVCTAVKGGKGDSANPGPAAPGPSPGTAGACNPLLRAAGRC